MKTSQLILVAIAFVALPGCASRAMLPTLESPEALDSASLDEAAQYDAAASPGCGEALPLVDGAASWTVEGFGGPDAQVFMTRRVPRNPCGAGAIAKSARLDALR